MWPTQTGSIFDFPILWRTFLLYFCFAPSPPTQAAAPRSNWCRIEEYLGQACSVLPPWRYSLQIPPGKCVLIERLGAAHPEALLEARSQVVRAIPMEDFQPIHPSGDGGSLHKQGELPRPALKCYRALKNSFWASLCSPQLATPRRMSRKCLTPSPFCTEPPYI